jgi:putative colanic acid biosynthesis UDP-glucose lipid carrier transferase
MYEIIKRCFDLLFAVLFLIVFSPIYLLTIIIIKIVSPGPAIYKAERVGKGGKLFKCYKFRSMRVDSGKVHLTTLGNDDRIFPFGKFIRKAKIDEMPQVVNILKGEMSVVGPRPEDKENADKVYVGEFLHIVDVKPGLTSTASLYDYTHGELYEDEELYEKEFMPKKLKLELYYINHRSLWYDFVLILKTAWLIILKTFGKKVFEEPKELLGRTSLRQQQVG